MNFIRFSCALSMVMCAGLQGAADVSQSQQSRLYSLVAAILSNNTDNAFFILNQMPKENLAQILDNRVSVFGEEASLCMTPLHYAICFNNCAVAKKILELRAPVNSQFDAEIEYIREVAKYYEKHSDELDPSSIEGMLARQILEKKKTQEHAADVQRHIPTPFTAELICRVESLERRRYRFPDYWPDTVAYSLAAVNK